MIKEKQLYKILVVEDNLGDYVLLEQYISDCFLRLEIINVESYKEFVQTITVTADYDILFLDLTLPDKYGIDLVKACLEIFSTAPIVVLTGYPDFNFAKQSLSLGISDYLLKEDLNATTLHKCIIYNIERHKSTLNIKRSEQYYSDLFQFSPNPLLVYDEQTLMILDVNDAAIATYHYNLEEFQEKKMTDLQVENRLSNELDANLIVFNEGSKFTLDSLECHLKKNDEILYVTCNKNQLFYKGVSAVIISIENLTNEILYIQSIQFQNKKLKQISWLQSHVVRAPLARIMGLINLLLHPSPDVDHDHIYKMVLKSSVELDDVIKEIVHKSNEM